MSRRFIYCKNGKIKSFHEDLLFDLNIKTYMHKFLYTSTANKCGLLFTSSGQEFVKLMNQYFMEESIENFTGPLTLVKFNENELEGYNKKSVYWIDNKNAVLKGEDADCYYFECRGYLVKIDKSLSIVEIYETIKKEFNKFIPYLIKILEGVIISQHIKLGFFPVHGGLLSKYNCNYLILGDSQAGKTTFMNILQAAGYEYLSDDILFFDLNGRAYPFGHYKKVMVCEKEANSLYENNEGVIRKVEKIPTIETKWGLEINKILLPMIKYSPDCRLAYCVDSAAILTQFLSDYPAEYFVWEEFMFSRSVNLINELSNKEVIKVELAYGRPNKGVEQLWELETMQHC